MDKDARNIVFEFFAAERKKFQSYVRRKIQRISEMDAEDIVEDVMLSIFNKADVTGIENLAAYVYRSLYYRTVDYKRGSAKTQSLQSVFGEDGETPLVELLTDNALSISSEAERKEFYSRLAQAISSLEPKQRAVFIATEMKGRTFKELSTEWGEPIGTLLSRKSRAVKALREMLEDFNT